MIRSCLGFLLAIGVLVVVGVVGIASLVSDHPTMPAPSPASIVQTVTKVHRYLQLLRTRPHASARKLSHGQASGTVALAIQANPRDTRACSPTLSAGRGTTCGFAERIQNRIWRVSHHGAHPPALVAAVNPHTRLSYAMRCGIDRDLQVVCRGQAGALVVTDP